MARVTKIRQILLFSLCMVLQSERSKKKHVQAKTNKQKKQQQQPKTKKVKQKTKEQ